MSSVAQRNAQLKARFNYVLALECKLPHLPVDARKLLLEIVRK